MPASGPSSWSCPEARPTEAAARGWPSERGRGALTGADSMTAMHRSLRRDPVAAPPDARPGGPRHPGVSTVLRFLARIATRPPPAGSGPPDRPPATAAFRPRALLAPTI